MAYVKPSAGRGDRRQNTTNYEHPQETNLLDLHRAMVYDAQGRPTVRTIDSQAGYTSKNRMKISNYQTDFFNTFQYGKETDVWDESTANGGSATWNSNTNWIDMAVTNTLGSKVIRQTRNVMRYLPGRSSQLTYAVRLEAPVTGIRRRLGLFDEANGFYFEDAGVIGADGLPEYNVVVRTSTSGSLVENRVPRSQWNGDRLDGLGPSGITADATKAQMITFDYEWYGAGQIVVGFVINGHTHIVHTFNHGNVTTVPWSSTPFLPIRLELENLTGVAGTHYMYQGSNSLISEGEATKLGIAQNITGPVTGRTMAVANTFYPILSIRLKTDALKGIVLPTFFQAATIDNTSVFYKLVRNATLTGASFVDMPDTNAFTQYDVSATSYTNGIDIDSGFVIGGGGTGIRLDQNTVYQLGRGSLGTVSDILTLAIASPNANKSALAAMTWIEQR
jgi:hypothetical protein